LCTDCRGDELYVDFVSAADMRNGALRELYASTAVLDDHVASNVWLTVDSHADDAV